MRQNLIEEAKKVLLGNKKKGFTLPTNNKLYPAQWKWDSGFIALGYSHFNLKYALDEITTLLKGQWKDGMICLLYTSPSPRDKRQSRMPSSA